MERRLAAILAADVVGYSRLVREDEESTLAASKAHREELIRPKFAQYHGRIVKLMGDGLLAEFSSAVAAVQCAVELEQFDSTGSRAWSRVMITLIFIASAGNDGRQREESSCPRRQTTISTNSCAAA